MRYLTGIIAYACAVAAFAEQIPFIPITGQNAPTGATFLLLDKTRGGLWMGGMVGGAEGLTYFDGIRFFAPINASFSKLIITGMAEDSAGGIWLATNSGVYRAFQSHLELVIAGAASVGITRAMPDLFLVSLTYPGAKSPDLLRIAKTAEGKWQAEAMIPAPHQARFQPDHEGNILYWCSGQICQFRAIDAANWHPGKQLRTERSSAPTLSSDLDESVAVLKDRYGCTWVRGELQTAYQCADQTSGSSQEVAKLRAAGLPSVSELDDGSILIPSFGKLEIGRPGNFRVITASNGFPGAMNAVATNDGVIWISNGNGLFAFPEHFRAEFWTEREGLDGNTWSIIRTPSNTFATAGETLRVLDTPRSRWNIVPLHQSVSRLSPGPNGTVLASDWTTKAVQLSADGHLLGEQNLTVFPTDDFTTRNCSPILSTIGLNLRTALQQKQCIALSSSQKTSLLYGSIQREGGFTLMQDAGTPYERTQTFSSGAEIGNATVRFFGVDSRGRIWRGSPVGIYVADPKEAVQGQWLYLNHTDGIAGTDANRGSFFSDPDGSVWFGLDDSINHLYPPADLVHPTYAPDIFISGYRLNKGEPQLAEMVTNLKSTDAITALVGSLQYDRRNALRFRYRLLPEQTAWQQTASLDLLLGNISAGPHTLEVQGRIFTGPWSKTVSRSFTVLRPLWLTGPYLAGYIVIALALLFFTEWLRRRRAWDERDLLPDLGEWRMDALEPEGHELTGTLLDDRYQVGKLLARGGFASVLAAHDRIHRRACAIKVFRSEVKNKTSTLRGFEQEVSALRRIHHPNVVSIYADGLTSAGAPYMVMEFIEGKNLRDILKQGPLMPELTSHILADLARALDAIHGHGICHRDVKPENVIVRSGGQAVLIDFSIAIIKDVNETLHGISRAAGTFDYMAPEQALGYAQPSSDIFSLAKLVIEMLTGTRVSELLPNTALDLPARMLDILKATNFGLSEESKGMLATALEFDPSKRPAVASCFAQPIVRDLA